MKVVKEKIRVRLAPSPTGLFHIGTARTALFNWLFARHHTGQFILRIEDTDLERSDKKFEEDIVKNLEWLGLRWDEFYRQSERTKFYSKYIEKLLEEGKAFWCRHSLEELEIEKRDQSLAKEPPRHVCSHKNEKTIRGNGIIRLAVDENSSRKIVFNDLIRGPIEFEERLLGDISIAKDVTVPLYNFAAAIDDYKMEISHVIRGEDHIANTPKQILVFEALGLKPPKFAHLPLILGPDRSKLSKRHAAVSVGEYKNQGYLPDALVNFMAFLGWTPEGDGQRELITKNEMIEKFSLEKAHKSGAVFDIKKLNWLNNQYIRMENDLNLAKLTEPFIAKKFGRQNLELITKLAPLFRERLEYLDQTKEFHFFFKAPEYDSRLLIWKKSDATGAKKALQEIRQLTEITKEKLDEIAEKHFAGDRGAVYWPLRVALSGEKFSPDPIEIAKIIGRQEWQKRIDKANSL